MQVLFKRSLQTGGIHTNRPRFVLWVKFAINEDEGRLIRKYDAAEPISPLNNPAEIFPER
jgi:hypothetical protein